jgi:hypothetical protein
MGLQAESISCAVSANAEEEQKIKRILKKKRITVFICTPSFGYFVRNVLLLLLKNLPSLTLSSKNKKVRGMRAGQTQPIGTKNTWLLSFWEVIFPVFGHMVMFPVSVAT